MKKLISLLLAIMMVFTLAATAFANDAAVVGSITINGISQENNYAVYKLLDLSYGETADAYTYTLDSDSPWKGFFDRDDIKNTYMAIDEHGIATWIGGDTDEAKADFAKLALTYAQENTQTISPEKTSKVDGDFAVTGNVGVFEDLPLGYYLVDSTMGALCGLTTTNYNASINAKNGVPTVDKYVKEDTTGRWRASNTAAIGEIVEYRAIIHASAGAQDYILHDAMENGLTFDKVTRIEHETADGTHDVPTTKYAVASGDGCICNNADCDFEIDFTQDFCDELNLNERIVVYYQAILNGNAEIYPETNDNSTWLSFGDRTENHLSNIATVSTSTFYVDIVKTDSANKLIDGAKFKIYDALENGKEIKVVIKDAGYEEPAEGKAPVYLTDSQGNPLLFNGEQITYVKAYRLTEADEQGVDIVAYNGKITVDGLDTDTYYLEETQEPAGYNILTARQRFVISDGNLNATFNGDTYSVNSGVQVVNKTGSMLPETGAMGTAMFIFFGTFAVLATGVLLVTKKRMSMIED